MSFAAYAFITLVLCIAYYLIDYENATNPVDRLCIERLSRSSLQPRSERLTKWASVLRSAVLTFSDLQIISSLSLLITGFSQFGCGFDFYHWQITVDLAWFSSITHLTTLTCLRRHFQQRLALKLSRMICMIIVAVMLSLSLFSTGWSLNFPFALPAQCLYHPSLMKAIIMPEGKSLIFDRVCFSVSLAFICLSYVTRIVLLFPSTSEPLRVMFRTRPGRVARLGLGKLSHQNSSSSASRSTFLWNPIYISSLSVYCMLKAGSDLYTSTLWEVRS